MKRFYLTLASLCILLGSLWVVRLLFFGRNETAVIPDLRNGVLSDSSLLHYKDVPLGNTERVVEKTFDFLQFDDYLFREYWVGNESIFVYISHWKDSDFNLKMTTGHNPDQCWVRSGGWSELRRIEQGVMSLEREALSEGLGAKRSISPIEYRLLESPNGSERYHVYFWQTWGGDIFPIRRSKELGILERMKRPDYWKIWEQKRKLLYFVRIHSKVPLARVSEAITPGLLAPISQGENGSIELGVQSTEQSNLAQGSGLKAQGLDSGREQRYLIDYPEVRELLLSIHKMTTEKS